jgi:glycosyltransferase involved in cell wall biosynthesis
MTTSTPLVTVILATYNWSSVLPFSMGSVLAQTMGDLELLVIGDGCTDDSEAVVRAQADRRVRWLNLPANTGHQSEPNNAGLREARGQFVAYLGHDDLWLPHHLDCLLAALRAGADVACGITALVGPDAGYTERVPLAARYRPGDWLPPSSVVHRRSVTEHVGGWRRFQDLATDPERELWRRMHDAGHRFVVVPRLTTVKFPALWRRNAYRMRQCGEQAAWLERIRTEPDFEAVELARLRAGTAWAPLERIRRFWRRLAIGSPVLRPLRPGRLHATRRRYKGLDGEGGDT